MQVTTGLRRAVALSSRVQSQRRFGGSLSKNKHIEVRLLMCLRISVYAAHTVDTERMTWTTGTLASRSLCTSICA